MVEGPHREARAALERAIRRISILEYLILGAVVVLALAGGALVAFLAQTLVGTPFRITWVVASILIFVLPAALVYGREARAGRGVRGAADARGKAPDEHRSADGEESGVEATSEEANGGERASELDGRG